MLLAGARVLILDEPTSVLTPVEVDGLFGVIRTLRAEGVGIVLITHKMREVREIADQVTVLRGGRVVLVRRRRPTRSTTMSWSRRWSARRSRSVRNTGRARSTRTGAGARTAAGSRWPARARARGSSDTDLKLYPGEVLGVAGVSGNGQRELADLLVGAARPDGGQILMGERRLDTADPGAFHAAGIVSVPADPLREFVVPGLSIAEHAALWERAKTGGRFDTRAAGRKLTETGQRLQLKLADSSRQLDQLSGGNIQRVLLALALGEPASVLVVSYPTRGLDVLTTETTRLLLLKARDAGTSVVLISEDLDEILRLSDRIAVLAHGHVSAIVAAADADRQSLGHLMTAHAPGEAA